MWQMDRRTFVGGAAGMLAASLLAGCDRAGSAPAGGTPEAPVHQALRCQVAPPVSIDPALIRDAAGIQVAALLFEPLMRFDAQTGAAAPLAAESCEMAEDALSCTFRLRAGASFHNGEPVRAESFKRAWERLVGFSRAEDAEEEPSEGVPDAAVDGSARNFAGLLSLVEGYAELRGGAATELTGVSCPDDMTLRVVFTEPCAAFPLIATHPALSPVPAAAWQDAAVFGQAPVGNGPCALDAEASTERELHLTCFEAHRDAASHVGDIVLELDRDLAAAFRRLETGRLDICGVPVDQFEAASDAFGVAEDDTARPGASMICAQGLSMQYLVCNVGTAPLESVAVRRALSLAIDRETLCEKALRHAFDPATGPVPQVLAAGAVAPWSWCSYDVEAAAEMLEPLFPADEDGSREMSLTIVCNKRGIDGKVADALVGDLKAVGVEARVELLERDALRERLHAGDFDLACLGWTPAYPDLGAIAQPLLSSTAAGSTNVTGYADGVLDEALAAARSQIDPAARRARLGEAFAMAGEAMPIIPLAVERRAIVAGEHVERVSVDACGVLQLASAELV